MLVRLQRVDVPRQETVLVAIGLNLSHLRDHGWIIPKIRDEQLRPS